MLWVDMPRPALWDVQIDSPRLKVAWPDERTRRILFLQGLHTVGRLADAAYSGALRPYPVWLQDGVVQILRTLRPALEQESRARRIAGQQRRARMNRLGWEATVIARRLSDDECTALARIEVRQLNCVWRIKHCAWHVGAVDALGAAILERGRLLAVEYCGPARVETLRVAIERALQGDRWADDRAAPPEYLDATHSVVRRSLTPFEVAVLAREPVSALHLSARVMRMAIALEIKTCLDLAATLDRDVWDVPGCGRRTFEECRGAIARRLDVLNG